MLDYRVSLLAVDDTVDVAGVLVCIVSLIEVVGVSRIWKQLAAFSSRVNRHYHELLVVTLGGPAVAWVLRHDVIRAVVAPVVVEDGLHRLELFIACDP